VAIRELRFGTNFDVISDVFSFLTLTF
jgi:hypothetical protein